MSAQIADDKSWWWWWNGEGARAVDCAAKTYDGQYTSNTLEDE